MFLHAGELALLKDIRERFSRPSLDPDRGVITGIGDDAAVIAPQKYPILVTTDLMHEGIHFDLAYTAPFHLGFKLVSVNASDIMAMGGTPRYLFLNVSMPGETEENVFREFFDGISAACTHYDIVLAGGDLSGARHDIVVSATVLGTAERPVTRSGASPGDGIYVTGCLGDSSCGLEILKRLTPDSQEFVRGRRFTTAERSGAGLNALHFTGSSSIANLDWGIAGPLVMRHLMPTARRPNPLRGIATAMIDVSDGLFIDLWRLCDESGTGAKVYLDRVPVSDEMKTASRHLGLDHVSLAVSGGEDYELLFAAPPALIQSQLTDEYAVTCIGEIVGDERTVIDVDGNALPLLPKGYQHFETS